MIPACVLHAVKALLEGSFGYRVPPPRQAPVPPWGGAKCTCTNALHSTAAQDCAASSPCNLLSANERHGDTRLSRMRVFTRFLQRTPSQSLHASSRCACNYFVVLCSIITSLQQTKVYRTHNVLSPRGTKVVVGILACECDGTRAPPNAHSPNACPGVASRTHAGNALSLCK